MSWYSASEPSQPSAGRFQSWWGRGANEEPNGGPPPSRGQPEVETSSQESSFDEAERTKSWAFMASDDFAEEEDEDMPGSMPPDWFNAAVSQDSETFDALENMLRAGSAALGSLRESNPSPTPSSSTQVVTRASKTGSAYQVWVPPARRSPSPTVDDWLAPDPFSVPLEAITHVTEWESREDESDTSTPPNPFEGMLDPTRLLSTMSFDQGARGLQASPQVFSGLPYPAAPPVDNRQSWTDYASFARHETPPLVHNSFPQPDRFPPSKAIDMPPAVPAQPRRDHSHAQNWAQTDYNTAEWQRQPPTKGAGWKAESGYFTNGSNASYTSSHSTPSPSTTSPISSSPSPLFDHPTVHTRSRAVFQPPKHSSATQGFSSTPRGNVPGTTLNPAGRQDEDLTAGRAQPSRLSFVNNERWKPPGASAAVTESSLPPDGSPFGVSPPRGTRHKVPAVDLRQAPPREFLPDEMPPPGILPPALEAARRRPDSLSIPTNGVGRSKNSRKAYVEEVEDEDGPVISPTSIRRNTPLETTAKPAADNLFFKPGSSGPSPTPGRDSPFATSSPPGVQIAPPKPPQTKNESQRHSREGKTLARASLATAEPSPWSPTIHTPSAARDNIAQPAARTPPPVSILTSTPPGSRSVSFAPPPPESERPAGYRSVPTRGKKKVHATSAPSPQHASGSLDHINLELPDPLLTGMTSGGRYDVAGVGPKRSPPIDEARQTAAYDFYDTIKFPAYRDNLRSGFGTPPKQKEKPIGVEHEEGSDDTAGNKARAKLIKRTSLPAKPPETADNAAGSPSSPGKLWTSHLYHGHSPSGADVFRQSPPPPPPPQQYSNVRPHPYAHTQHRSVGPNQAPNRYPDHLAKYMPAAVDLSQPEFPARFVPEHRPSPSLPTNHLPRTQPPNIGVTQHGHNRSISQGQPHGHPQGPRFPSDISRSQRPTPPPNISTESSSSSKSIPSHSRFIPSPVQFADLPPPVSPFDSRPNVTSASHSPRPLAQEKAELVPVAMFRRDSRDRPKAVVTQKFGSPAAAPVASSPPREPSKLRKPVDRQPPSVFQDKASTPLAVTSPKAESTEDREARMERQEAEMKERAERIQRERALKEKEKVEAREKAAAAKAEQDVPTARNKLSKQRR